MEGDDTVNGQNEQTATIPLYPQVPEIEDRTDDLNVSSVEGSVIGSAPASSTVPLSLLNFWAVNGYKQTVKRIDDGPRLCDDFLKLLVERGEIEGLYATKLQGRMHELM